VYAVRASRPPRAIRCPFFVGFLLGDVVAVFAAEAAVAKYGEIK